MGALMGGGVGLTIGFIFGSYSILRYASPSLSLLISALGTHVSVQSGGAGPRGFLATLSQYMLSSAATFSFFLAIGSVRPLLSCVPFLQSLQLPFQCFTEPSRILLCRGFSTDTLLRLFGVIPFFPRILKPHDFRCYLLYCVLGLRVPR
jgi:Reactive mitochondrial oxygen species modulator 1